MQRSHRRKEVPRLLVEPLEYRLVPSSFAEIELNNTIATANAVTVATGDILTTQPEDWLTISGSISPSSDLDYFQFTINNNAGVFFDIDARDTGLSTTLDSVLDVFDASGVNIGGNDDGYDFEGFATPTSSTFDATSFDSSLYLDLTPGTYHVRVSSFSGLSSGQYELRLLADTNYASTPPVLNSLAGASDTLYLDFDGHSATDDWGTYTALPFDLNSNDAQFSPSERLAIHNIWRIASEDFSPFAINVTTVNPNSFGNGQAFRQVITMSDSTIAGIGSGFLGVAWLGSYTNSAVNTAFTFANNFPSFGGGISGAVMAQAVEQGNTTSHEFGHALHSWPLTYAWIV